MCDVLCSLIHTHLQRTQSIVVDHVGVTPQFQQLADNRRISAFGRVHERRKTLLIRFIDPALRKSVAAAHAVYDNAHVARKGSEVEIRVPDKNVQQ